MDDRRATAAASKGNICNLGDDLMMYILSRLPPKPLAICKCVSKSWRHLVSTLIHSPTRPRQVTGLFIPSIPPAGTGGEYFFHYCHRGDGEINVDESLSFLPSHPHTRIVDSRGGFLLCSSYYGDNYFDYACDPKDEDNYCVCNPLTRQWVPLPLPPKHCPRGCGVNAALVLDESSDFGCLRYKVVQFSTVRESVRGGLQPLYIDVYSSNTGKWVESKAFLKVPYLWMLPIPPVHLDGVLFLWTLPFGVVMYNIKEEWCKMFDLVTSFAIPLFFCTDCLGESEGRLNYARHDGSRMQVWRFQDDTSGWVLKHNMKLSDIGSPDLSAGSGPVSGASVDLLAFHPTLPALFIRKCGDFFWYNFDTKALEAIMSWDPSATDEQSLKSFRAFPFSECICPLPDAQYK